MNNWQPIETAPKDGSYFMAINAEDGHESVEVGRYDPLMWDQYELVEGDLYRKVTKPTCEWSGFNNMHRMTHWMPLPLPPKGGVE